MAGRQGFEPRYADPESAVLPLDDLPTGDLHFIKRCKIVSTTTHRSTLKLAMRKLFRTSFSLALAAFGAGAVDWKALQPEGCVSDFARVIDGGSRQQLEVFCKDVEHTTGAELLV